MRRSLSLLAVAALGLGAGVPSCTGDEGSPIHALAVGDSITTGYGPTFEQEFEQRALGKAHVRAQWDTSPCNASWASWIRDFPKARLDYVVIEDYAPGGAPCADEASYRAAMRAVVDAAKAKGAFVIVLAGQHPDLSSLIHVDVLDAPVPPPDQPDAIHYTAAGSDLYARDVVDLLDTLIP